MKREEKEEQYEKGKFCSCDWKASPLGGKCEAVMSSVADSGASVVVPAIEALARRTLFLGCTTENEQCACHSK